MSAFTPERAKSAFPDATRLRTSWTSLLPPYERRLSRLAEERQVGLLDGSSPWCAGVLIPSWARRAWRLQTRHYLPKRVPNDGAHAIAYYRRRGFLVGQDDSPPSPRRQLTIFARAIPDRQRTTTLRTFPSDVHSPYDKAVPALDVSHFRERSVVGL